VNAPGESPEPPKGDGTGLVTVEDRESVRILTLNRPKALNALSGELISDLSRALRAAGAERNVRAVIITGSDRAFCAGADISQIPTMMGAPPLDPIVFDELFEALDSLSTPTIAAVRGMAFGGGCELALACDLAVAGESATFAVPEVRLGVLPGGGGTQRLVHALGKAKAMRMLLTGEPVTSAWAERSGLISEVVDDDAVLETAVNIAESIAANAPLAVRLAADAARHADEVPLAEGLAVERRNFLLLLGTEDAKEGVAAFAERRPADFRGE
jgi:enoyl-CoA hydratase